MTKRSCVTNDRSWPIVAGNYKLGSPDSPVAVLIIGNGAANVPLDLVRVFGTMKTENLGLEKVIVNIISEPCIRFLIVCGREEFGHFPSDAVVHLVRDGVDERGRVVEARSAIPYLTNIPREAIERFRRQVEVIDLVHPKEAEEIVAFDPLYEFDAARNEELRAAIEDCRARDPGPFPEGPMVIRSRTVELDPAKTTKAIDNMAIEFTSQMLRLPSEKLSTEASVIAIAPEFGILLDVVDGVVREAPSVEFAERLRLYYRGVK
jgi:tetrahydromethanopterin S-methyltransferase subunit A